ncbi:MAG: hypothetical protein GY804_03130 [Alphaproteobacteria bacterium]|nr:hypothetical protein [Alphaproteobacteria bacterium]
MPGNRRWLLIKTFDYTLKTVVSVFAAGGVLKAKEVFIDKEDRFDELADAMSNGGEDFIIVERKEEDDEDSIAFKRAAVSWIHNEGGARHTLSLNPNNDKTASLTYNSCKQNPISHRLPITDNLKTDFDWLIEEIEKKLRLKSGRMIYGTIDCCVTDSSIADRAQRVATLMKNSR